MADTVSERMMDALIVLCIFAAKGSLALLGADMLFAG